MLVVVQTIGLPMRYKLACSPSLCRVAIAHCTVLIGHECSPIGHPHWSTPQHLLCHSRVWIIAKATALLRLVVSYLASSNQLGRRRRQPEERVTSPPTVVVMSVCNIRFIFCTNVAWEIAPTPPIMSSKGRSKGRPVRCPVRVGLGTDTAVYSRPDRSSWDTRAVKCKVRWKKC